MMKINPTLPVVDNSSWIFPIFRYRVSINLGDKNLPNVVAVQ